MFPSLILTGHGLGDGLADERWVGILGGAQARRAVVRRRAEAEREVLL